MDRAGRAAHRLRFAAETPLKAPSCVELSESSRVNLLNDDGKHFLLERLVRGGWTAESQFGAVADSLSTARVASSMFAVVAAQDFNPAQVIKAIRGRGVKPWRRVRV